jgi:DegV family protein with EDD domain
MTDSSCDLSRGFLKEIDVAVIPLEFSINDEPYFDGEEGAPTPKQLYDAIRAGDRVMTSQVTQAQYEQFITKILDEGYDVLCLAFSSGLSGSCGQAFLAAEALNAKYTDRKVRVIDTLAASRGQGLLVWDAAIKKVEGLSFDELADWTENNKLRYHHYVTVNDLHQLKKGGRISATSEFVGTILDIKPMIYLNTEGKLIPNGKQRGRKRALNTLISGTKELITNPTEQTMLLCHGDCLEEAEYVRSKLIEELGVKDVLIDYCGTVIGSHTGPGVIAVFFTGEPRT